MCSRTCGARRRRDQAKERRDANVGAYRQEECKRQRRKRARDGEEADSLGPPDREVPSPPEVAEKAPPGGPLSRAEWAAQVRDITSVIVENVDKAAALSRADFGRQVTKIIRESVAILGRRSA